MSAPATTPEATRRDTPDPEAGPIPDVAALLERQRAWFDEGHTLPRAFREAQLRSLLAALERHEDDIYEALWADLHKPRFEAFSAEVAFLYIELKHALKHLKGWMKPTQSIAPLAAQPGRSMVYSQPLGQNLILGAWNYPVQLSLAPLIGAIAGGNTAVVKPSELAPHSSQVVADVLASAFPEEYVACVQGGVDTSKALLAEPWDHVFFTGGPGIGKIVARAAAEHLSKVTLELGGKSPAIVTDQANLEIAARRIAWGKWMNCGQTCIAPDYVLVHDAVHDELVRRLKDEVTAMYGEDPKASEDYGRIIATRHFDRIAKLVDSDKVVHGGQTDRDDRYIAPTILDGVDWDDAVMQEEIFGPVLPILSVSSIEAAIRDVRRNPHPLALYLFTEDSGEADAVIERVSFGGGCVNNVVLHLADPSLPFGGIRGSGTGAYHGKHSFDCFTHKKSVLRSSSAKLLDLPLKYPPYEGKLDKIKWILG